MGISKWIKAAELKELYERHGFGIIRITNMGFCALMKREASIDRIECIVEIPSGAIDNDYDIKQALFGLSRNTGIDIVDLFLSHENVIKRIIENSKSNKYVGDDIIKETAMAVSSIFT